MSHDSVHAAAVFYSNLVLLDPSLRAMFPSDMTQQRQALMEMLNIVVNGLYCFDELVPDFADLGRRHASYGVVERQYAVVRKALLLMLAEKLGDEFTPEVETAWTETYNTLAGVMKAASYAHT